MSGIISQIYLTLYSFSQKASGCLSITGYILENFLIESKAKQMIFGLLHCSFPLLTQIVKHLLS